MVGTGLVDWEAVFKVATPEEIDEVIRGLPTDRFIEAVGVEKTLEAILAKVPPDKLQEMLERRLKKE